MQHTRHFIKDWEEDRALWRCHCIIDGVCHFCSTKLNDLLPQISHHLRTDSTMSSK